MRVVDGCGSPRLPNETLPERLIGGQCRSQDLQRHRAVKALVVRTEHHGHAALTYLLLEQIAGDPRTGRKAARHDGIPLAHLTLPPHPYDLRRLFRAEASAFPIFNG